MFCTRILRLRRGVNKKRERKMKFNNIHEKLKNGSISRRQFNKMLSSLGIASASMTSISSPLMAATSSLEVLTWSGYDSIKAFPEYVEKYGEPPTTSLISGNEEARAKVRKGYTPDLACPSWSVGTFYMEEGLTEPLDVSRIPRWGEVFERLRNLEEGDQRNFVPFAWGNTAIVYRKDMVPDDLVVDSSWGMLWDERLKGKIAIRTGFMSALLPAGIYGGAKNAWNMTDAELEMAADLLRKQRDLVRFYWKAEADVQQALASGEVAAANAWNSTYTTLKQQGVPVGFLAPREGMPTWVDGYMLIKGGDAPEKEKYDFLNSILSAEAGRYVIEELGYGSSNEMAFKIANPEAVDDLGVGEVQQVMDHALWSVAVPTETKDKMVEIYNKVRAGF